MTDYCRAGWGELDVDCELAPGHDGPHQFSMQWSEGHALLPTRACQWEPDPTAATIDP